MQGHLLYSCCTSCITAVYLLSALMENSSRHEDVRIYELRRSNLSSRSKASVNISGMTVDQSLCFYLFQ